MVPLFKYIDYKVNTQKGGSLGIEVGTEQTKDFEFKLVGHSYLIV